MAFLKREDLPEAGKEDDFWSKTMAGLFGGRLIPLLEDASSPEWAESPTFPVGLNLAVPAGEGRRDEPYRCEGSGAGFFQIGRDPVPCSAEARQRRGSDFNVMALSLILLPKLGLSLLPATGFF